MRFLFRHRFAVAFVLVLLGCSLLVVRQYWVNQWQHVDLREDFIVLDLQGQAAGATRLYQLLVQQLPGLPDRALIDDEDRLAVLFLQKKFPDEDLVAKYYVGVQNELQRRNEQRVARALKRAEP
ncbi:MAG TPA: hypothetical protein VFV81_04145 [Verrucomicrobiae bacterium]|nr:hypothetical protein [Verrucomicrobiae bacterium]